MRVSRTSTLATIVSGLAFLLSLASVAFPSLPSLPTLWAAVLTACCLVVFAGALRWEMAPESFTRLVVQIRHCLGRPLLLVAPVIAVLVLSILGTGYLRSVRDAVDCSQSVRIDADRGGIFRAAEDHPERYPDGGRIGITPEPWEWPELLPQEPVIAFSYSEVAGRQRNEKESGGAHLRFYDDPVPISDFDSLSFSIKGESGKDDEEPDVAVRLVVDDPTLQPRDREVVVREAPSLQELGHFLTEHWQRMDIDLGEFEADPFLRAPEGIDPDSINKIAFIINNDILGRSRSGTVLVKDISFTRHGRSGACP